jgi:hypothetical protein
MTAFKALLVNGLINCVSEVLLLPRHPRAYWIGLLIYAASFLLVAVADFDRTTSVARGYYCAFVAFVLPLRATPMQTGGPFADRPLEYFSVLISGLINPVFLIYVALASAERTGRAIRALRVIVPLMIPFCWVVFHYERYDPREGHFLWILGMLLVLYSDRLASGAVTGKWRAA